MFFKKKVYPILPTSESDTMTFIQKLDYLEYKVNELNEKVIAAESAISDLETAVESKSTVTATAEGSTLQTLTVDGTTYNVPQGGGGDAGISGSATVGAYSIGQWHLVDGMFFLEVVYVAGTDAFADDRIAIRLKDADNNDYTGLDGTTIKTVISWLHTESAVTWPVWAEIELAIVSEGLGNLTLTKGAHVLTGDTPLAGGAVLDDLKGLPLVFMNVPTL